MLEKVTKVVLLLLLLQLYSMQLTFINSKQKKEETWELQNERWKMCHEQNKSTNKLKTKQRNATSNPLFACAWKSFMMILFWGWSWWKLQSMSRSQLRIFKVYLVCVVGHVGVARRVAWLYPRKLPFTFPFEGLQYPSTMEVC
jgi:hypothetical protein